MLGAITLLQLSYLLGGAFAAPAAEKPPAPTGAPPTTNWPGIPFPPFLHPTATRTHKAHPPVGHPTAPVLPPLSTTVHVGLPTFHPTLIPLPFPIEPPILPLKEAAVKERSEQVAANAEIANNLSKFQALVDDVKERVAQVETSVRDINITIPLNSTLVSGLIPGLTTQLGGILGSLTGLPSIVGPLSSGLGDLTGALLGGAGALLGGAGTGTSSGTIIGSPFSASPTITYLSLWAQLFNALGQLTAYFFNTGPLAALGGPLLAPITSSLSSILGTVGGAIPLNSS